MDMVLEFPVVLARKCKRCSSVKRDPIYPGSTQRRRLVTAAEEEALTTAIVRLAGRMVDMAIVG